MTKSPVIALLGALDTKGPEYAYARDVLIKHDCEVLLIDFGVLGEPSIEPDVAAADVARAAGIELEALRGAGDRGAAMKAMAIGAADLLEQRLSNPGLDGVLSLGGSNAAYVLSVVAARLPIGFPKLLLSTMAAGDTRAYVGETDLTMMYPIVDINGLNRVSRVVIRNAALAIAGMAHDDDTTETDTTPVAAISMLGVTTAVVTAMTEHFEQAGIEPLSFHATGAGGRTMESLISTGLISGVADITTSELADELVGGICSAGPERLTAAGRMGCPQVVSLGGLDMVKFGARDTVPERFADRVLFEHNPQITLMRTSSAECEELGRRMAARLNTATGPTAVLIPRGGFSQVAVKGQPFHDPMADAALIDALLHDLEPHIEVYDLATDINDPAVATTAADTLIDWMKEG